MFIPSDDFLSHAAADILVAAKPGLSETCAALDQVFAMADQAWQGRRSTLDYMRSAPPVACKAGCGWCCHQQVGVSVPEALRIATHLKALPPEEGAPLMAQVAELDARTRGLTTAQRMESQLPCAFLGDDGACRIYSVRPLRCRGLHSIDAQFCASSYQDPAGMRAKLERGELKPVFLSIPEAIFNSALSGVLLASRKRKWAIVSLELTAAVAKLLTDSRLASRWLGGAKPDRSLHLKA